MNKNLAVECTVLVHFKGASGQTWYEAEPYWEPIKSEEQVPSIVRFLQGTDFGHSWTEDADPPYIWTHSEVTNLRVVDRDAE